MKSRKLSAVTVRNSLIVVILLCISAIVAGFGYGLSIVRKTAVDVNQTVADAGASNNLAESLQNAQNQLNEGQTAVQKANSMFVGSGNYQDQTIKDLRRYADKYGLSISDFKFGTLSGNSNTTPRYSVGLTIDSPVQYSDFIRFISAIEGNVPKMQILDIHLSRPNSGNADQVNVSKLDIGVFAR